MTEAGAQPVMDPGYIGRFGYQPELTEDDLAAINYADDLIRDWPGDLFDEQRKPEVYRFIRMLLDKDLLLEEIRSAADKFNFVNCRPGLSPDELDEVVQMAIEDRGDAGMTRCFEPPAASGAAPDVTIRFLPNELIAATDTALAAMLADKGNEPVLSYDGFCTIRRGQLARYDDVPSLRERAMRSAKFYTYKYKTWTPDSCPDPVVQTLLARNGQGAPEFRGLLPTPTICANGRLIDRAGLDAPTGLFATFRPGEFWALDDKPNLEAARKAYRWLVDELFDEFPFSEPLDAAVAVAALLTGLVRRTCGLAPAFIFDSATRSSGKTTLAQLIAEVSGGSKPMPLDWADKEEETAKVIFAALREARPALLFDNVRTGTVIDSAAFAKLITADTFGGRVLGVSKMGNLPSAVLVLLTGTNVRLQGDSPTRILSCRLDPRMERPDTRTFKRDVSEWAQIRRPEIVQAALTIIRAYLAAGTPDVGAAGIRFATWDRMVRRPLLWASGVDVAAKTDSAYEADETVSVLRDLLRAWRTVLGEEAVTAGRVHDLTVGAFDGHAAHFAQAMAAFLGEQRLGTIKVQLVGRKLKDIRDRVVDGQAITSRYDTARKQHLWYLHATQNGGAAHRNGGAHEIFA